MNHAFCSYCAAKGDFSPCLCSFGSILSCADKPTCATCATSHRKVFAPFFRCLLKTQAVSRSNSPRTKLLQILHETIVFRRSSIRQAQFCLDSLRRTSPFDQDGGNFRGQVLAVAQSLELNQDIAGTLEEKIAEANVVCVIERLADYLRAESETGKSTNGLRSLVKATGAHSRASKSPRSESRVRETNALTGHVRLRD
jgi:hypothetical protein